MDEITSTKNWIQDFVIDLNLCPFAKKVYDNGNVYYKTICFTDLLQLSLALDKLITNLEDENILFNTGFIILKEGLEDFDTYLEVFEDIQVFLDEKYASRYQLASFHPNYIFEGLDANDKANYTNRSPFPLIHVLDANQVAKAIENYGDTSVITANNIGRLRDMNLTELKS